MKILLLSLLVTGCITTSIDRKNHGHKYFLCTPAMKKMMPSVAQNCFETMSKREKNYDADEITKACYEYALKAVCSPATN